MSTPPKDGIEDAQIVSEESGASSVEARPDEDVTTPPEAGASEVDATPGAGAPPKAGAASETGASGGGSGGASVPAPIARAPEPERRGDSVPLLMALLGGVLAAGIGWAVATYMDPAPEETVDIEALLAERDAEIAELRAEAGRVSDLEARIAELPAPAADRGADIDTLAERLAAIEARPEGEGPDLTPIEQALLAAAGADEALAARIDAVEGALDAGDPAARIDALEARIDTLSVGEVEGAVEPEALGAIRQSLQAATGRLDEVGTRLDGIEETVADLPDDPGARLDALSADIEAIRVDLAALEEGVGARVETAAEGLRAELAALQGEITSREEALEIERVRLEEEALAAARAEALSAAVAEIRASVDSGEPFAEPVAALAEAGADVPAILSENADGVPTLPDLQDEFPDLARATLASAPADGAAGFLSRQLGVRSVEPRDGDDPDAVLSRAEAALRSGDLEAALSEIEALDAPLREPLADWTARAQTRAEAVAAAAALDAQ